MTPGLTRALARHTAASAAHPLPQVLRHECARAFVNWIGCVLGGCSEEAVALAAEAVAELGGAAQAQIVGLGRRTDVASAAFVNCIASSVMAYDDAHLPTVTHPSGPVGSALLAFAQRQAVPGEAFARALHLGIEITCRLANVVVLPPARFHTGFYVTGLVAPIGVALAVGQLMGLDEDQLVNAIGIAASQSGGFRATHGTMTAHFRPGHAARAGIWAAQLAARGFTSDEHALEAPQGFLDVFAPGADPGVALAGIGTHHEMLANAYKPYPCGIVIHPTIDACLELRERAGPGAEPEHAILRVHPLAVKLTGVREPRTTLESHVSLVHWAAAALVRGAASLPEMRQDCIADPRIAALRASMETIADPTLGAGQARAQVRWRDGRVMETHIQQASGSSDRPLSDAQLDAKFNGQAAERLSPEAIDALRRQCWRLHELDDVGRDVGSLLP
jgi:2-methylcitrate dehydratase PrpD